MDLENKIKNHLKDASSLEGVDVNDLWNNIEKGLEEKKTEPKAVLFKKRYLLGGLMLLFTTSGVLWSLFFNNSNKLENYQPIANRTEGKPKFNNASSNNKITLIDNALSPKASLTTPSINKDNQNSNNTDYNSEIEILDNLLSQKDPLITPSINEDSQNSNNTAYNNEIKILDNLLSQKDPLITPSINKDNQNSDNTAYNSEIEILDNPLSPKDPLITPRINKDNQNSNNTSSNNEIAIFDNKNWKKYNIKSSLKINALHPQDLFIELPLNLQQKHTEPGLTNPFSLNNKGNKTKFSIGAFVGLHTIKNTFFTPSNSDNISDLLNKGYQYELGGSIGFEVDFRFYKSLFVLTGFEYNQSMSEFNSTQTWGITISNPSSPTGYSNATATRVVKHHNKMSYCAIPLLLGVKKATGRFEWGVSLGVHFNFTQSQIGKTLDQYDNVVVLDARTTKFPVSRFFMSYTCRPFINYQINNNIRLQLRIDGRYQNYGFSDLYQLNHAAIYMGLSLGAQFKF